MGGGEGGSTEVKYPDFSSAEVQGISALGREFIHLQQIIEIKNENKTWKLRTRFMSYPPCDMEVCPAKASVTFNAHTCPTKPLIFTKITVLISKNMEKMSLPETIKFHYFHCIVPSKKKKKTKQKKKEKKFHMHKSGNSII